MKIVLESRSFVHLYIVARCDGPYLTVYGVYGCAFYVKLVQRRRSRKFVVCGEIFARAHILEIVLPCDFCMGTHVYPCVSLFFLGVNIRVMVIKLNISSSLQYNWLLEEHLRRSFR